MNEHEMRSDDEVATLEAWERQQRTRKRWLALAVVGALVVGFAGAAVAGRMAHVEPASAQATNVAPG